MSIKKLTDRFNAEGVMTVAVVDHQWGDAGKGKLVDCLAEWADIIARGTGGANAGHTIKIGDETHVFHLVPSGILHDKEGKLNVIGRGVAVDPRQLANEIIKLRGTGQTYDGLRISCHALLVLPIDIALDQLKEAGKGNGTIGTTGRGIGPVYESRVGRIGLTVNDLLNKEVFKKKLKRNLEARLHHFKKFDNKDVMRVLHSDALENGAFYAGRKKVFDVDRIVERYLEHAGKFSEAIVNTDALMREAVGKKRVLLEGAQGLLLSVSYGTYPYVTSSDCSVMGLAEGVGLSKEDVDYTLGVVKAPYMSRVGKGPFPTELGGGKSAEWCGHTTKAQEKNAHPDADLNKGSEFERGVAIRQAGDEYGSTTGRPRRVGWLDLPLLRYAVRYGGNTVALTKVDVLDTCEVIKLCVSYRYEGDDYRVGDDLLTRGSLLGIAVMDLHVLEHCMPVYTEFPGWCSVLRDIRSKDDIPPQLKTIIREIEVRAGVRVDVLSVGPDREETIIL